MPKTGEIVDSICPMCEKVRAIQFRPNLETNRLCRSCAAKVNGVGSWNKVLDPFSVARLIFLRRAGKTYLELASEFGISQSNAFAIANGEKWADVYALTIIR